MTKAVMTTELKNNIKYYLEQVIAGDCIIVPRANNENVIMIRESEYQELLKFKEKCQEEK